MSDQTDADALAFEEAFRVFLQQVKIQATGVVINPPTDQTPEES